jgi:uncharacterized membrane protein YhaH (DUF805 family)
MFEAIRYNLRNLGNFHGRDNRPTFWFYVLFIVIVQFIASMLISLPLMGGMAMEGYNAATSGSDGADLEMAMLARMGGWMRTTMWLSVLLNLAVLALLVAAFTRRLHDSNHSGLWCALAAAIQIISALVGMWMIGEVVSLLEVVRTAEDYQAVTQQQAKMAGMGLIGWIPAIIVIFFGIWPSTDGANRYGEEPAAS